VPEAPTASWRPAIDRPLLRLRAEMLAEARHFFAARGILEVDTPLLGSHTVTDPNIASFTVSATDPGGDGHPRHASFLQTSPEFFMKRLIAAGAGDIYQLGKVFRAGEAGSHHNPEFTLIEWYRTGFDHLALMAEVVALAALRIKAVDLGLADHTARDLDRDGLLDFIFATAVQPRLGRGRLDVIENFPRSQAALARVTGIGDDAVAQRFELFCDGVELANGYHELADAGEQRRRMDADRAVRRRRGLPDHLPDRRLPAALDAGLPDCAGVALGFDRLMMLRSGILDIREVLPFPYELA